MFTPLRMRLRTDGRSGWFAIPTGAVPGRWVFVKRAFVPADRTSGGFGMHRVVSVVRVLGFALCGEGWSRRRQRRQDRSGPFMGSSLLGHAPRRWQRQLDVDTSCRRRSTSRNCSFGYGDAAEGGVGTRRSALLPRVFVNGVRTVDTLAPSDALLVGNRWQHRFSAGGSDDEVDVGSHRQNQPMSLVPAAFGQCHRHASFVSEADGPSGPDADAASFARQLLGVRNWFVSAVATPRAHSIPPNCTGSLSTHGSYSRACMADSTLSALRRAPKRAQASRFASGSPHEEARSYAFVNMC